MLKSSETHEFAEFLKPFNITFDDLKSIFIVESRTHFKIDPRQDGDIIDYIVQFPAIMRLPAIILGKSSIQFSLCAWFVTFTDISSVLLSQILNSRQISDNRLEDLAYFCTYVHHYNPGVLSALNQQLKLYYDSLRSDSKLVFIKLFSEIGVEVFDQEFMEIFENNWREGPKDLSLASFEALLKLGKMDGLFTDFSRIEQINDIKILADALVLRPNDIQLFRIFREKMSSLFAMPASSTKRTKILQSNISTVGLDKYFNWIRVLSNLKDWPTFEIIKPIDLLSNLALSSLFSGSARFKAFYQLVNASSDQDVCDFLKECVPEALKCCPELLSSISRPLMQLFAQVLKRKNSSWEVLLAICRLFMDNFLGSTSRKSFVRYLASQVESEEIGVKCLELISTFIEKFPESRYICLSLIKSLLDGVDAWEAKLIEPFYSSFSLMARSSDSVMNDLILILKKQIYSSDVTYKRIGARGVGVFLKTNGSATRIKYRENLLLPDPDEMIFNDQASCSQRPPESMEPAKNDYQIRIIVSLLEEAVKSLKSDQQAILILLKYFSESFNDLDDELKDWIGDWSRSIFQENFITQIDDDLFKYKYELDQDNPLALKLEESGLSICVPVLLDIMGKYEKYQNSGDLEGIDALQGCAIQLETSCESSLCKDFQFNFLLINYFRANINTFTGESKNESKGKQSNRLDTLLLLQEQIIEIIKTRPAFLSEFKFFPECHALIRINQKSNTSSEYDVIDNSFLDDLLNEARKPENRIKGQNTASSASQLQEVNERSFFKSLLPLNLKLIEEISVECEEEMQVFILTEVDILAETVHYNDPESLKRLVNCCLNFTLSVGLIDFIVKCQKGITDSQRSRLNKIFKDTFIDPKKVSPAIIQSACKLVIDVLNSPQLILEPLELIKETLKSTVSSGLKNLLSLPSVDSCVLIEELKSENEQIPLKNRLVLLRGVGQRISKELKKIDLIGAQNIFSNWAELIQSIRRIGKEKLLLGIVKESQFILERFLNCQVLKDIEENTLLLEGSKDRDKVILLFKTVQQSTRSLQIICNHLKYSSSASSVSTTTIPNLKKTLESLIFRVKEILSKSGCSNAFWMGNLKHRDLEGQELSSQVELLKIENESESESEEESLIESKTFERLEPSETSNFLSKEFISDSEAMNLSEDDNETDPF